MLLLTVVYLASQNTCLTFPHLNTSGSCTMGCLHTPLSVSGPVCVNTIMSPLLEVQRLLWHYSIYNLNTSSQYSGSTVNILELGETVKESGCFFLMSGNGIVAGKPWKKIYFAQYGSTKTHKLSFYKSVLFSVKYICSRRPVALEKLCLVWRSERHQARLTSGWEMRFPTGSLCFLIETVEKCVQPLI